MRGMAKMIWQPSVFVWLQGKSALVRQSVKDVEEAAEILLYRWPKKKRTGEAYDNARQKLVDCWEGNCDIEQARQAFEDAAREAGILHEGRP